MTQPFAVVAFAIAAALGALGRAELGRHLNRRWALPLGTLATNAAGAFAMGLATARTSGILRSLLCTALLGTFTTVSSFARDTVALLEQRRTALAVTYAATTMALGVALAAAGLEI